MITIKENGINHVTIRDGSRGIQTFLRWFKVEVISRYYLNTIDRDLAEFVLLELLNNGYEHGNKNDQTKEIMVSWQVSARELQVSIEDEGEGFVPNIPDEAPPLTESRGRGLWAISTEELVDSFLYSKGGRKVTVTLVSPRSL